MNIIEFLQSEGITLRAKNQSEYASPCPVCGGNDRFQSWPDRNRWYCRGCAKSGDLIDLVQLCKGLPFSEACRLIGEEDRLTSHHGNQKRHKHSGSVPSWRPEAATRASDTWKEKAVSFLTWSHEQLLRNPEQLKWLHTARGINLDTVKRLKLGWNSKDFFRDRSAWGVPESINQKTGKPKKLFIPSGLVIPGRDAAGKIALVKIRRPEPPEGQSRYYFLPGGSIVPCFFGDNRQSFIVVESELDAVLLCQEAGDSITAVSTGSAANRPDSQSFEILSQADHLLVSLDNDDAGGKASIQFWQENLPASELCFIPSTFGKDHTAAFLSGFPLARWLKLRLEKPAVIEGLNERALPDNEYSEKKASQETQNDSTDSEPVEAKTNAIQATESRDSQFHDSGIQAEQGNEDLLIVEAVRLAGLSGPADQAAIERALNTINSCRVNSEEFDFALSVLAATVEDAAYYLSREHKRAAA